MNITNKSYARVLSEDFGLGEDDFIHICSLLEVITRNVFCSELASGPDAHQLVGIAENKECLAELVIEFVRRLDDEQNREKDAFLTAFGLLFHHPYPLHMKKALWENPDHWWKFMVASLFIVQTLEDHERKGKEEEGEEIHKSNLYCALTSFDFYHFLMFSAKDVCQWGEDDMSLLLEMDGMLCARARAHGAHAIAKNVQLDAFEFQRHWARCQMLTHFHMVDKDFSLAMGIVNQESSSLFPLPLQADGDEGWLFSVFPCEQRLECAKDLVPWKLTVELAVDMWWKQFGTFGLVTKDFVIGFMLLQCLYLSFKDRTMLGYRSFFAEIENCEEEECLEAFLSTCDFVFRVSGVGQLPPSLTAIDKKIIWNLLESRSFLGKVKWVKT